MMILFQDRILRAGYERFLEILSEASRHVPYEIKQDRGEIEWADIAAIGNHLRHAYHKVDVALIWKIYETGEIAVLRDAAAYFIESLRTR